MTTDQKDKALADALEKREREARQRPLAESLDRQERMAQRAERVMKRVRGRQAKQAVK